MLAHPEGGKSDHCLDEESSFSLSFNNKRERRAADVERKQFVCRPDGRRTLTHWWLWIYQRSMSVYLTAPKSILRQWRMYSKVCVILLRKEEVILSRQNGEKSNHLTLGYFFSWSEDRFWGISISSRFVNLLDDFFVALSLSSSLLIDIFLLEKLCKSHSLRFPSCWEAFP